MGAESSVSAMIIELKNKTRLFTSNENQEEFDVYGIRKNQSINTNVSSEEELNAIRHEINQQLKKDRIRKQIYTITTIIPFIVLAGWCVYRFLF